MNSSWKSKLAKWSRFRLKRNIRRDTAIQSWQSRIKVLAFSEKLMVELRRFVLWLLVDDRRLGVPKKSTFLISTRRFGMTGLIRHVLMTALCSTAPISRYIQISVKVVRIMDKCKSHLYKVVRTDWRTDWRTDNKTLLDFPTPLHLLVLGGTNQFYTII